MGYHCVLSQFRELPQATFVICVLPLDGAHSFRKSETSFTDPVSYATDGLKIKRSQFRPKQYEKLVKFPYVTERATELWGRGIYEC